MCSRTTHPHFGGSYKRADMSTTTVSVDFHFQERAVRMASSSCTFTATLRPSLPPPPALRRSLPTLQSVVSNPLACSLRLKTASRVGVNRKKLEYRASSAEHVITTEKAKGKVRVLDSEDSLAASLAEYAAHLSDKFAKQRGAFTVVLSGGSLIKSLR